MHFFLYSFSEDDLTPHLKAVLLICAVAWAEDLILRHNKPLHHANYTNNEFCGQNTRMYIKFSSILNHHYKLVTKKLQNDIMAKIEKHNLQMFSTLQFYEADPMPNNC